jgi:hypothetical protein
LEEQECDHRREQREQRGGQQHAEHTSFGSFLLAADFHHGTVDVFDGKFRQIPLPPDVFFHDPKLPKGYAPFNVMVSADKVYVRYAKQD